ncbi:hypothetical protein L1049_008894 [Liquidambar formosana]|uniref:separase n=1 Tax=Liquidambar formosana TaxID=63359 RepID=A0AAP0SAD1_LIQFO
METPTESSLISKLETSDYTHIHHLFSIYLHPFTDLTNPKTTKISKTPTDPSLLRPLAKKYLPFLTRALSLLPKRLSESQPPILELFDTYKLCLQCLECLSSQLSCKPYSVYFQRVRMIHCFEACGRFKDAETEGFRVLERLRGLKSGNTKGGFLPGLDKEGGDSELGLLVVEVVVTLVKCACMSEGKDGGAYRRVLTLVDEVKPWFRVLDANAYEKLYRVLVTYLSKCTLFLVGALTCFDGDLVRAFCSVTLTEYMSSSMKDQIQKFACRICSSLFSQQENGSSLIIDLLTCVLDSVVSECKIKMESTATEFLEIVSYCADKCRNASTNLCIAVATHLDKIAANYRQVFSPFDLIMRIYAMGLYFTNSIVQSGDDSSTLTSTKDEFAIRFLLHVGDNRLQHLAALLGALERFHIGGEGNSVPFCAEYRDSVGQMCSHMECNNEASIACPRNKKDLNMFYFNALKFFCQPLAESVNSAKKQILAADEGASFSTKLCAIQDAFLLFCDVFLSCRSCTPEREINQFDENNKMVLSVAVAAFTLSFRTNINMQKSANFIKHFVSNGWLQPQGLKFIFVSLYNVGVILFRNKQVKEASKALKLCCRASWVCVLLLCEMFVEKSKGFHDDLSEATIVDFVTEACAKSAFLLDVLHQCASHKVNRVIVDCLENWSVAGNFFKRLPSPIALVRQWVKIECKLSRDVDVGYGAPKLYLLLSSSEKMSRRTVGSILEQELVLYEEMHAKYPIFCQRMQMKIIDILLQDVYVTEDSFLQKSRIFIKKGKALRDHGIDGLKDCIHCLSEAISTIKDMHGEGCSCGYPVSHQLAVAYCLRALCTQEADPNSEQIFQDIHAALNLWLNIHIPVHCSEDDQCNMVSEMMLLLYHIVDLLSMRGHMRFHHDIYKLMIRLFKWKNVSLEKSLAMLWEYRRLGHALCASPVSEAFIRNLSEHFGELSKSVDFWTSCLSGSQPLLVGFQQNFSFLFSICTPGSYHHQSSSLSHIAVNEVKEAAVDLISSVSVSSHSVFVAGFLYYDLCERLISNGRLIEALSYAKEAHRLRSKLFQEKFAYSIEQHNEKYNESGETIEKNCYGLKNLQMFSSVATEVWSCDTISWDLGGCMLTPWNVLQCYLESTLQVGTIHEIIGNGTEAEILLLWGKNISSAQGLPLFIAAFSSVLGKLYRKKRLLDLAEKELQNAKQIVLDNSINISCLKCRLILEVTIDQELGDLSRSHFYSCTENPSIGRLSYAENLYKSAMDKLNLAEWKNSISSPEEASSDSMMLRNTLVKEVECGASNTFDHCATDQSDVREFLSKGERPEAKIEAKKYGKTKKASKPLQQDQCLIAEHNLRMTRSRTRYSQNKNVSISGEVQIGLAKYANGNVSSCTDTFNQKRLVLEVKNSTVDFGCEVTCVCNKMKCWQCLRVEVMESGSVNNFILMKWECVRRKLSLRLLTGIGKCLGVHGEVHKTHKVFLQSISVLVSRNPFCHVYSSVTVASSLDLIGKEIPGDVLAIERAAILYNICWFSLKSFHCKDTRIVCCDLSQIQIPRIVSWLSLAFILCREVPVLFQKVSRLLAAIYVLSASSEPFSLCLSSCKVLSESHWASFFHQASIGTHLNHQLFSSMAGKPVAHNLIDVEGSSVSSSACTGTETYDILRLAPESIHDLEKFVTKFFQSLPCSTVICMSLLGGAFGCLLRELLHFPSSVHSWMLLSHLNSKSKPVVILLPADSILEASDDDSTNSGSGILFEDKDLVKKWHCPWGSNVVDDVVPAFKLILEENYLSSSIFPLEDSKRSRSLWWIRRKKLDQRLGKLLRDLEDSWLGPWKYLLLGEWSDCRRLDSIKKKLVHDLKCKYKVDVNESLLKGILGGAKYAFEKEECFSQIFLNKGCYIGRVRYHDGERCETLLDTCGVESLSGLAFQLILEAANELEEEECVNREPIILVLDCEVQMLPWENIPILRNQEVYRMPSVGSIPVTLDRSCQHQGQVGRIVATFPLIDPLDAFYLLNPSGDLSSTQVEFENWFKDHKLEGKAGLVPTTEELAIALKSHDLFIYFGHGSGAQYIPGHEIQKLENCAATLLMGCSSGSLCLNGSYNPQGIPLSYLLGGSPVIVANLWEVTDKDIDRFGKAMLDAWLKERSTPPSGCVQCSLLAKEFKSMNIRGCEGNAKKKVPRKKLPEACDIGTFKDFCDHRPKIGSFISQAREACTLPFLIGAAPVCYGIPTGIKKKKDS